MCVPHAQILPEKPVTTRVPGTLPPALHTHVTDSIVAGRTPQRDQPTPVVPSDPVDALQTEGQSAA